MDLLATIPIFPLASVVLFPKLRVPLYIFEPRYRQMTQAALDGDRLIGMTTVLPDQLERMSGDPDIFDIGCEGSIDEVRRRPDGTFDLVLLGGRRFQIKRELPRPPETLYRESEIEYLPDEAEEQSPEDLIRLRSEVQQRYRDFLQWRAPQFLPQFESERFRALPHDVYANTLALSLACEDVEKQSLLEARSTSIRLREMIAILEFQSALRANPSSSEPNAIQ